MLEYVVLRLPFCSSLQWMNSLAYPVVCGPFSTVGRAVSETPKPAECMSDCISQLLLSRHECSVALCGERYVCDNSQT